MLNTATIFTGERSHSAALDSPPGDKAWIEGSRRNGVGVVLPRAPRRPDEPWVAGVPASVLVPAFVLASLVLTVVGPSSHAHAQGTTVTHVPNIAGLKALAATSGLMIVRDGYNYPGDGGAATYVGNGGIACNLVGDNGLQVSSTAATGCWIGLLPSPADVRIWGAKCDGVANDSASITAATAAWPSLRIPGKCKVADLTIAGPGAISTSGTASGTTSAITGMPSTVGMTAGEYVLSSTTSIAAGCTIQSVDGLTQISLGTSCAFASTGSLGTIFVGESLIQTSGTLASGSATISGIPSTLGMTANALVSGNSAIPSGATITSITGLGSIVISKNATSSVAGGTIVVGPISPGSLTLTGQKGVADLDLVANSGTSIGVMTYVGTGPLFIDGVSFSCPVWDKTTPDRPDGAFGLEIEPPGAAPQQVSLVNIDHSVITGCYNGLVVTETLLFASDDLFTDRQFKSGLDIEGADNTFSTQTNKVRVRNFRGRMDGYYCSSVATGGATGPASSVRDIEFQGRCDGGSVLMHHGNFDFVGANFLEGVIDVTSTSCNGTCLEVKRSDDQPSVIPNDFKGLHVRVRAMSGIDNGEAMNLSYENHVQAQQADGLALISIDDDATFIPPPPWQTNFYYQVGDLVRQIYTGATSGAIYSNNEMFTYIAVTAGMSGTLGPANTLTNNPLGTALNCTGCSSAIGAGLTDGSVSWLQLEATPVNPQANWGSLTAYGSGATVLITTTVAGTVQTNAFISQNSGTRGASSPSCPAPIWTTGTLVNTGSIISGIPTAATSLMSSGMLAANTTKEIPYQDTVLSVGSGQITLTAPFTVSGGGTVVANGNLVVGSSTCIDNNITWALVGPAAPSGTPGGSYTTNGLIQAQKFTALVLEGSSDVHADIVAHQTAFGLQLFPRGSNDSTIRRATVHLTGDVQYDCLYDAAPPGYALIPDTWQNQTVGWVDRLTLDHWQCRTNGFGDAALYLGFSKWDATNAVSDTVNYTNLRIDGGSFVDPVEYGLRTHLTYSSDTRWTPGIIQGEITGGAKFSGCLNALNINDNFQMKVAAGAWFETTCTYTSGNHNPIYFNGTSPAALGYIALEGPSTAITATQLATTGAGQQGVIAGWGGNGVPLTGTINPCGSDGNQLLVCGGPLVRGITASTPLATGTIHAACNYSDFWMIELPTSLVPKGYICTGTTANIGTWTAN